MISLSPQPDWIFWTAALILFCGAIFLVRVVIKIICVAGLLAVVYWMLTHTK